jgi:hypothetical protein
MEPSTRKDLKESTGNGRFAFEARRQKVDIPQDHVVLSKYQSP